jgi:hypothetical protein
MPAWPSSAMMRFGVSRMGDGVSAVMTESVSTGEIVSMKTVVSPTMTIVVKSTVWMAPPVCRSVSVSRISTAAATPSAWVTYVVAALSRNHTNEE